MAERRWKIVAIAATSIAIALAALWYVGSPAWTLKGMQEAARANDADRLDAYIDYPAVRESLRAELMTQLAANARTDRSGLGSLELAFGSVMAEPLIDGLVTPAGIRAALLARGQASGSPTVRALHIPDRPQIVRRGLSEFLVTARDQPGRGLLFRRQGLSWKLSGVVLPARR